MIPTTELIDAQVARNNATMRMVGSTKFNKDKVLTIDGDYTMYDAMIQLFRAEDVCAEQHIYVDQRMNKPLDDMFFDDKQKQRLLVNEHWRKACKLARIDLTEPDNSGSSLVLDREDVQAAFNAFHKFYEALYRLPFDNSFRVKSVVGSLINLQRQCPSKCLLSGRVHDHENAYLRVTETGDIYFHCRRGCKRGLREALCIFASTTKNLKATKSFQNVE